MFIEDLVHLACATINLSLAWYAGSLECAATELGCSACPLPSAAHPMALPCARAADTMAMVVGLVGIHSCGHQCQGRSPLPLLLVD
jgi:hypothetical protein